MLLHITLVVLVGGAVAGPVVVKPRRDLEAFKSFLEEHKKDDQARFNARMLANPLATVWENSGKFQGDILLNDAQVQNMIESFSQDKNAYIWPNTTWPDNTVVYEFATEFFDAEQIVAIMEGMEDIERHTCVKFRPREEEEVYVRITGRPGGCYANVGFWEPMGVHTLNLALNRPGLGCFRHTTIVHEWMHILGFLHMQSTHNRDDYVVVLWENILDGLEFNFDKYSPEIVDNLGLPYEYDSSMHYGRYGFSKNGQPTLLPLADDNGLMGQTLYITDYDWLRVNRHYNCPGAWDHQSEPNRGNIVMSG